MSGIIDRSGVIAVGGTRQPLMVANHSRNGFMVQNVSIGDLWINVLGVTAVAGQPSILIAAGEIYETPSGLYSNHHSVDIYGATTNQAFTAMEW